MNSVNTSLLELRIIPTNMSLQWPSSKVHVSNYFDAMTLQLLRQSNIILHCGRSDGLKRIAGKKSESLFESMDCIRWNLLGCVHILAGEDYFS